MTLSAEAQTGLTKDSLYLDTIIVNDTIYWQLCRQTLYDNGQSSTECGPFVDSTEMNRRLFRDAHQSLRFVAAAYKTTAIEAQYRSVFNSLSVLIDTLAGEDYYAQSEDRYGPPFTGLLIRVTEIATDSTFFAQINSLFRAREVEGAAINNPAKTYSFSGFKVGGYNRTLRFFDADHIRLPDLFGAPTDFVLIGEQVTEQGIETGRQIWRDKDALYRLVIYRDLTQE